MADAACLHLRKPLSAGPLGNLRHALAVARLVCLGLSLALATVACGKLPRPFELGDKQVNPLLVPPEGGELLVQRPTGMESALEDAGAALLAEGLTRGGVVASAISRNAIGADLLVHVERAPINRSEERLLISWEVLSPSGVLRGEARQDLVAPIGAWSSGDPAILVAAAEEAAPQLAPLVSGSEPDVRVASVAPETSASVPVPEMAVGLIEGAPGSGDLELGEALVLQLAQQGIRLLRESQPDKLLVEGKIALGPPEAGQQEITLVWTVKDGLDGAVLGSVEQQNRIPRGSLDRRWGEVAYLVAQGAVEGIVAVLRRKDRL